MAHFYFMHVKLERSIVYKYQTNINLLALCFQLETFFSWKEVVRQQMNHPDFDQDSVNKINIFVIIILLVHTI